MSSSQKWLPRSVSCLRGYTARQLSQDLIAGLTVGLVALPLAMAFAIASGVPPQAGLYTAVVAGFLISSLGLWRSSAWAAWRWSESWLACCSWSWVSPAWGQPSSTSLAR